RLLCFTSTNCKSPWLLVSGHAPKVVQNAESGGRERQNYLQGSPAGVRREKSFRPLGFDHDGRLPVEGSPGTGSQTTRASGRSKLGFLLSRPTGAAPPAG